VQFASRLPGVLISADGTCEMAVGPRRRYSGATSRTAYGSPRPFCRRCWWSSPI